MIIGVYLVVHRNCIVVSSENFLKKKEKEKLSEGVGFVRICLCTHKRF